MPDKLALSLLPCTHAHTVHTLSGQLSIATTLLFCLCVSVCDTDSREKHQWEGPLLGAARVVAGLGPLIHTSSQPSLFLIRSSIILCSYCCKVKTLIWIIFSCGNLFSLLSYAALMSSYAPYALYASSSRGSLRSVSCHEQNAVR